jgi:MGT family glycosyltransferase
LRVLVYTSPARGHLFPAVPIVQELQRRGHTVVLLTLASQVELLRTLGIDAGPISSRVEAIELDDHRARSMPAKAKRALATFLARATPEAPDLAEAIAAHDPQLLLIDVNCWGAATVAEASGLPWAMYAPYILPIPSRDLPPFGPGLAPARNRLHRVRDALVGAIGDAVLERQARPPLGALRERHGLRRLRRWSELFERPGLMLALTAEGFEYARTDWPANVKLVGAINWSPPQPPPAWLDDLRDPLVLVTCSTELQRDRRLVRIALQALPTAGMSVLATTAAHDPAQFQAPPGSRVTRFVPHDPVLARAACVVCHGGMGITQKALSAEVPVVVVPFGRDQLETARRVELAGAGVRLSPGNLTPERLAAAVRESLDCRPGAQRVSRAYAAAGGAVAAVDALEGLAGCKAPAAR